MSILRKGKIMNQLI